MARPKRYGSEAEKQAAYRLRKKGLDLGVEEVIERPTVGGSDVVTPEPGVVLGGVVENVRRWDFELTGTDLKFENERPSYYVYERTISVRNCLECGKKFDTRMELNRFCTPVCKKKFLDTHFDTTKCKG